MGRKAAHRPTLARLRVAWRLAVMTETPLAETKALALAHQPAGARARLLTQGERRFPFPQRQLSQRAAHPQHSLARIARSRKSAAIARRRGEWRRAPAIPRRPPRRPAVSSAKGFPGHA